MCVRVCVGDHVREMRIKKSLLIYLNSSSGYRIIEFKKFILRHKMSHRVLSRVIYHSNINTLTTNYQLVIHRARPDGVKVCINTEHLFYHQSIGD